MLTFEEKYNLRGYIIKQMNEIIENQLFDPEWYAQEDGFTEEEMKYLTDPKNFSIDFSVLEAEDDFEFSGSNETQSKE